MKNQVPAGHFCAMISVLIWGTASISTKLLLNSFVPVEIMFFRFLIGFAALLLAFPHRLRIRERKHELYFVFAGLCGVTLYFLLENIALTYTFASNVAIILSVAPCFTAILAHLFLRGEALMPRFFMGFAAALAGICLITFNGSAVLNLNPLGDLLAVLAAFTWAIYSTLLKKISAFGYHTVQVTRRIFLYGLILMLPALPLFDLKPDFSRFTQLPNLLNLLYLGLGASALCFATWSFAVKVLGAVKTSVYIYVAPVVTVITSAIVLRERITSLAAVGMALTLAGLFISESKVRVKSTMEH